MLISSSGGGLVPTKMSHCLVSFATRNDSHTRNAVIKVGDLRWEFGVRRRFSGCRVVLDEGCGRTWCQLSGYMWTD